MTAGRAQAGLPQQEEPPIRAMLRQYRQARGLSQSDLAQEVGISQATVARFELGKSMDEGNTVRLIGWLFRVPGQAE